MSVASVPPIPSPAPAPTSTAPPALSPQSHTCPQCSAPVDAGDPFCPSCGAAQPRATSGDPGGGGAPAATALDAGFRCENCGASVRCEPGTRTTSCPFCAAPYVVAFDPDRTGRQEPEFVIGFAVTPDQAERAYLDWLGRGGFFRPSDLRQMARAEGLRGIYLPFWSFSVRADSTWSAQIGEHWYRTETYTERDEKGNLVTKTRQVQETEWWPLQGRHHAYYSFFLVSASKGLSQDVFDWIQPFQLLALKRYAAKYLAGWLSEEYAMEKDAAYAISQNEFRAREERAIGAFLPGDQHSSLQVDTAFSGANSDLILLPIYLRSYRYNGKLYRVLINGQTGTINGERPVSGRRIAALVGLIAVVAVIIWMLVLLLGGGR